ncbi:RHS repeat-associated core domain-containing protein [Delftia sp. CH05]|uniref:RHS repeat-associated core domain-containing protein n=1 Tax=Delftia sp. CH05 TaxID=2692194 RepID=UPI00135DE4E0|nr:hypothetical protein [Delftia sp. CH05]
MVHSQRGARQALYIYEPGIFVPLATIQGAGEEHSTYWYQCDQIGAPLELTDEQGQVAWAADYKVWGEAVMRSVLRTGTDDRPVSARAWGSKPVAPPPPPPIEQPFRFQGQQFDEETGLHYNRFRYYDPVVGRFVSQDPIGLEGGINLFLNSNNTTGWIDPYGLAPFKPCPCTCKKILDNMKANGRDYGAKSNTAKDGHHIIQDAAAKTIPKYSYTGAPAIQLGGPSTKIGSEHYIATQIQREAGGGTYAAERRIGYKAIRKAGLTEEESKCLFLMHVDPYFNNLGVTSTTPMQTVANRR